MLPTGIVPLLAGCCGLVCCVAAAPNEPGIVSCQAPETSWSGFDEMGMIQQSARVAAKFFGATDALAPATSSVDCHDYPELCEAPFNCDLDAATQADNNLYAWCSVPQYADYVTACLVDKDLVKAAWVQFNATAAGEVSELDGDVLLSADASYCFLAGHCSNTAVTNSTTLEDAEQMCDDRYGHEGWSTFLQANSDRSKLKEHVVKDMEIHKDHFSDRESASYYVKLACAMGNFHCDVVYCKETYCTMPEYIERFAHLQPETPGHLIQEK